MECEQLVMNCPITCFAFWSSTVSRFFRYLSIVSFVYLCESILTFIDFNQVLFDGIFYKLGCVGKPQFILNIKFMGFYGFNANEQVFGYFFQAFAVRY